MVDECSCYLCVQARRSQARRLAEREKRERARKVRSIIKWRNQIRRYRRKQQAIARRARRHERALKRERVLAVRSVIKWRNQIHRYRRKQQAIARRKRERWKRVLAAREEKRKVKKAAAEAAKRERLRAELVSAIERNGGYMALVVHEFGKCEMTVYRWVRRFDLWAIIEAARERAKLEKRRERELLLAP